MDINKTNEINLLYNFYHSLLTEKQEKYMNLYYVEDFSLRATQIYPNPSNGEFLVKAKTTLQKIALIDVV